MKMLLEAGGIVGVTLEIGAIGKTVAKQDVHDRAGERTVRAGSSI